MPTLTRTDEFVNFAAENEIPTIGRAPARAFSWERRIMARVLRLFGNPRVRLVLWNGEELNPPQGPPVATVYFRDRAILFKMILDPDLQFGDGYCEGRIDIDGDFVELIEETYRCMTGPVQNRLPSLRRRRNTLSGSRENIHHHYDIGNDFYRLWLDERLVYTCAYFPHPDMTLEDAQVAKMDHVCRKLRLQPGERVVEAGCGWGSLALHMAAHYGVNVRAFNISHEQIVYAREAARRAGLTDRVEFVEDDYRSINGQYHAFMSVGMLEHVGPENYQQLGGIIDRCLTPSGRGLIHTIGRHRPMGFGRWIETRIFPGARPPALSEMMEIFEPNDFTVLDVENIRLHYAQTLHHWLERFERVKDRVAEMFDERFVRAWRLYLAGSIAGFTSGWVQLFQVVFNRHRSNNVPWTRAYLYDESRGQARVDT